MDPHERAGHAGPDAQSLAGLGNPAEDAPDEGALPLAVDPGVVVIGDQGKGEAGFLGPPGVADQVIGPMLLAGQCVADLGHRWIILSWPGRPSRPYGLRGAPARPLRAASGRP